MSVTFVFDDFMLYLASNNLVHTTVLNKNTKYVSNNTNKKTNAIKSNYVNCSVFNSPIKAVANRQDKFNASRLSAKAS